MSVTTTKAWKELEAHYNEVKDDQMRTLFADDAKRFEKFSLELDNMVVDYSKNRITEKTISLFEDLAKEVKLEEMIKAMFAGEKINTTERNNFV